MKVLLSAALAAALAIWAWTKLSVDQKPAALFVVARDQEIMARVFCEHDETSARMLARSEEPSWKLFKFGVEDFDRQLIAALKLDHRCNGLHVLLTNTVDEAVKTREFMDTHLYLYVDYYPGQTFADWSLYYDRERNGLRSALLDLFVRPNSQTMRPLTRGNVADIASEACSLADLKRGRS